jgi:pantoate--beta-alanine ligase
MQIIEPIQDMRRWSEAERYSGRRIVLVPTMGFLHEGHLRLVREGKKRGDRLVVSIFVNPAQFAPHEDFKAYPRDFERDRKLLDREDVDVIFRPSTEEMYGARFESYVYVERLSPLLCGASRPGHFRGVATVVAKLFNIVRPHAAVFGLKDFQQFRIISRMVEDLNLDVELIGHPIVREEDGLAMSSRNAYLTAEERKAALALYRCLSKARALVSQGERSSMRIIAAVRAEIAKEPQVRIDYVRLTDLTRLQPVDRIDREALLALAAWVGKARLIDNTILKSELTVSNRPGEI